MKALVKYILTSVFVAMIAGTGITGELSGRVFDGETNNLIQDVAQPSRA